MMFSAWLRMLRDIANDIRSSGQELAHLGA